MHLTLQQENSSKENIIPLGIHQVFHSKPLLIIPLKGQSILARSHWSGCLLIVKLITWDAYCRLQQGSTNRRTGKISTSANNEPEMLSVHFELWIGNDTLPLTDRWMQHRVFWKLWRLISKLNPSPAGDGKIRQKNTEKHRQHCNLNRNCMLISQPLAFPKQLKKINKNTNN